MSKTNSKSKRPSQTSEQITDIQHVQELEQDRFETMLQLDSEFAALEQDLQARRNNVKNAEQQLTEFHFPFGHLFVNAVLAKEIEETSYESIANRLAAQSRLDELFKKRSELTLDSTSGILGKAKIKARQVILDRQINSEENKLKALDKLVGQELIERGDENLLATGETIEVINQIGNVRSEIRRIEKEIEEGQAEIDLKEDNIKSSFGKDGISNIVSVREAIKNTEATRRGEVKPRKQMTEDEVAEAWKAAKIQMIEELSPDAEMHLQDLLVEGEEVLYKIRSSPDGKRSQLVLTDRRLIIFSKGFFGGQGQDTGGGIVAAVVHGTGKMSVRIYPLQKIDAFEFQPAHGVTVGHFQVFTGFTREDDNESKFLIDTNLGYFKSMLVYRRICELNDLGSIKG